jgi:hypothetical protein
MRYRAHFLRALLPAALLCWALTLWAAPTTKIKIVVKTLSDRPIDRAEVILRWNANAKHPRASFGRNIRTQFESRSNQDGTVTFPDVPQGSILIQVNAKGYQTFGQVYDIDEEDKTVEVKLNPPQQQYTSH